MKLRLVVQNGSLAGRDFELQEGSLGLGRNPECALSFAGPEETEVGPLHAMVRSEADGFHLVDNRSTSGTYVNGQRVETALLRPGDVIRLGEQGPQIQVQVELGEAAAPSGPGTPAQAVAAQEAAARAAAHAAAAAHAVFERMGPDREKNYLTLGLAVAFVGWMLLVVFAVTVWQVGVIGGLVGWLLAFLPLPFLFLVFLLLDAYDPEPPWALAAAFFWGAFVSIAVSFFLNSLAKLMIQMVAGPGAGQITPILVAPPVEEATKAMGVLLIFFLLRKEFDGVVDGIVYGGVVALGFAVQENVIYYGRAVNHGDPMMTVFLRGVLAPFSHSLFTAMTGAGLGLARESRNKTIKIAGPIGGFCAAMFLHMMWNGIATLMQDNTAYIVAYFVVWVPIFLMFCAIAVYLVRREGRSIRMMLDREAGAGVLSPDQVTLISSLPQRLRWLASSIGNIPKLRSRLAFLRSATKLALCRWDEQKAREAGETPASESMVPFYQERIKTLAPEI